MDQYLVLGVMSGSSLDGLDLCLSRFIYENQAWSFKIQETETVPIHKELTRRLQLADQLSSFDLLKLDIDYGEWIGHSILTWLGEKETSAEIIGIHGHTVFHSPSEKISLQIGNGQVIAEITGIRVIDSFRSVDVLKGGQGAPLVPVGEHHLFADYQAFVNLGGIANIAVHKEKILAWDVAPCNQVLNHFARLLGKDYDKNGVLARSGSPDQKWSEQLWQIDYFRLPPPKSLSNQWTQTILSSNCPEPHSALHTYSRFLATLLTRSFEEYLTSGDRVMITGGGTFNNFLTQELKQITDDQLTIVVPSPELIAFKEALIFGFLGLLKTLNQTNIFSSVTGAKSDSVAGTDHRV